MTNPRFRAIEITGERNLRSDDNARGGIPSDSFGVRVFNRTIMQKMLPAEVFKNLMAASEGQEKLKEEYADTIAVAMKEWAISHGATHYCHWFQPLTGATAEKHDAFIEWSTPGAVIEKFSGKQLIQGEPDASSFPSGGLRTTFEARGYTGWDPTSPVFVWKAGDGITLCIPSVFFSWTGAVLDSKIPLLRSDEAINKATMRLLNLTGIEANSVFSTLGTEQEYFVVDRSLRNLRPDLVMLGRTVLGAAAPKGQELQDHYFGSVKDRILNYMHDFELAALELGIPLKTRHNEVAPAQHEVAPVYEKASAAIDHNILLMELMRQIAMHHDLSCLLHEKPFAGLNGSGKHCNWSLSTDTGINLLDPTDTPENNLHFLVLLTAILHGVHRHSALLRASIGSAANDFRLGGHEAPPAIISVYLGEELEGLLEVIEKKGTTGATRGRGKYNLGLHVIPELTQDNTDRNRTSPFAFTGNKFEFRAVGSSASPALPITVLNVIVAQSLNEIIDAIEKNLNKKSIKSDKELLDAFIPVLREFIKESKAIRFAGDNYSFDWVKEAKKRQLPNIQKSIYAFEALKSPQTVKAFKGILSKEELISRYEIQAEIYGHTLNIEANLIIDLFNTQVLPAAIKHQNNMSQAILSYAEITDVMPAAQVDRLDEINNLIEEGLTLAQDIKELQQQANSQPTMEKRAVAHTEQVFPKCEELRAVCDRLEELVDDSLWTLPKYRELLFLV
ncbi:MAG: glutamine synthetase III [Chlamydiia bacterium]|nr:glutamine synthetase III [Chlamydiia bacterium]